MATPIGIPKLGWEMEEGTLIEWLIPDGEQVQAGQPLYVIETDKVESTIDAPVSGTVRVIGVPGEVYDVGQVIAEIT
jgi:pyruvate/2-oxoglutarate dehydrogenase complex dihydrolipoamide acyltransferase (E2) component